MDGKAWRSAGTLSPVNLTCDTIHVLVPCLFVSYNPILAPGMSVTKGPLRKLAVNKSK